ncbi:hypothetical protein CsatB_007456 [Cannabis sativa]
MIKKDDEKVVIYTHIPCLGQNWLLEVKKDRWSLKMEGAKEGKKGLISSLPEIYEFTLSFHLIGWKVFNCASLSKVLSQNWTRARTRVPKR